MSTGAKMLISGTVLLVCMILNALYFRRIADRVESGEMVKARGKAEPAQLRQIATIFLVTAPLFWIIFAAIAFGVLPSGIDTIKF